MGNRLLTKEEKKTIVDMYENNIYTTIIAKQLNRSQSCIERFLNAINSKDYAFAYSKLLHIQKNNYYPTLGDFENYIKNNLFNKFKYECDDGITISDNMYQFNVILYDTESENIQSKNLQMTVTLLDEEENEFNIAFIME